MWAALLKNQYRHELLKACVDIKQSTKLTHKQTHSLSPRRRPVSDTGLLHLHTFLPIQQNGSNTTQTIAK